MKYIRDTMDFSIKEPSAISLGKFDGLHQGHKYLLREIEKGKEFGYKSVAFTFDISPRSLSQEDYKVLLTNREKEQVFSSIGIDYVIECPFTQKLKMMEPCDFLRMLTERINVKEIVAGTDFRFGCDRRGSCLDLLKYADDFGYRAVIVDKVCCGEEEISSTRIRNLIEQGELEKANVLLGYPYFLTATVRHGNAIGKKLGFPTINQRPPEDKLLPPNGVYASMVTLDDKNWYGVSDIGYKPTVGEDQPFGVETHIFDFDSPIYDRDVRVSFLTYLRPERQYDNLNDLRRQIAQDCENAKTFCETNGLQ